jgi:hypothetical protein
MDMSWVQVNGPKDRDVFDDFNFTKPAGRTNVPFRVHSGTNTFMLITPNLVIEARTKINVHAPDEAHPCIVELWPVTPQATGASMAANPRP